MNRETRRAASSDAATGGARGRTGPVAFLREVRSELRKVAWPSRQEVVAYTIVVLVVTTVLTTLVWGLDWVIARAIINVFE